MIKTVYRNVKSWLLKLWSHYAHSRKAVRYGLPICLILFLWYIFCLPSPLFNVPYSTVVSDRRGELLGARIADDQQWRFPESDSVPEKYKICLIEFEDRMFNYHWGINPLSIFRAIKQNFTNQKIVSGASTITMQTIRLSRKEERTFGEKFIEMILATRLEFSYSKDDIIALYASHAPMGGNVVGIEAASWRYFGHSANQLSWAEAATLAVLPNSPALMHFGRNRDKLLSKRNRLLEHLYKEGTINEVDYHLAVSELLPPQPLALPQIAPHLVTKIYKEQKGKDVITTIDKYQQERIEDILIRWNAEFAQNGIKNIAAIVIDAKRNEVTAYCGNVHFEQSTSGNQVDIIQAPRSTGSILKPFLYCAMLQEGELLPNQLLPDIPISLMGFTPKNFSLHYDGAVPASEALARSLNIPFVIALRKYSLPKFFNLLKKGGMTTLNRPISSYGLSLILGGGEGKLWEISGMYLQMVQSLNDYNDDGHYKFHDAPAYILNKDMDEDEQNTNPLFTAGAVWQTLDALTNVNRPEELDWRDIPSMRKIAWKTGTSFGFRDGWAIGMNPNYVVGVWVGNSDGEGRPGLIGARTAGRVLFDIFNTLPQSRWFTRPDDDLVPVEVCRQSGMLKGYNCPESSTDTILVCRKGLDAESCPYHKLVHLSEDSHYQVYEDCAGKRGIVHTSWFILPPSWEYYYKEQHQDYRTLPPYSPECRQTNSDTRLMEFVYPYPNTIITIPRLLDGTEGQIVFEIAHRSTKNRVYWHLDDIYIGETRDIHKKEYTPSKGEHRLTVVDESGASISMKFIVR